jgi:hypothetical protein
MKKEVLIYYTHMVTDGVRSVIDQLAADLPFEIKVVGCCSNRAALDGLSVPNVQRRIYLPEELRQLPYPHKLSTVNWETFRGGADLPILRFFRDEPTYDRYWVMEYDVRYTGSWRLLFEDLGRSESDLLCTQVGKYDPRWMHWKSMVTGNAIVPVEMWRKAFLPFFRVSRRLLHAIDECYQAGWSGNCEAVWPTIAHLNGLNIEEIGGDSDYVPRERRNKYYLSASVDEKIFLSTFNAWPYYSEKSDFARHREPADMLWHPVKE